MSSEIANFYLNKCVFITGATGFLGKVLVEKLLRSCPEVKRIYILIRSKKGQDVNTRLNHLFNTKIFEKLQECDQDVFKKVVPIEGDITIPGLGISENNLNTLIDDVSIVFHSAATVRFNETLRTAVNYNVLGTQRVIEMCHKLPKLLALIYVSTAYSNCNRLEIDETVYPMSVSPQKVIELCESKSDEMLATITPQLMEGYPNTYTFTKGLAENLIIEESRGLPIAIIRPSIVTGSWQEPLPGWVDSFNTFPAFMVAIGKGIMRIGLGRGNACVDIIPVDTVINLMISMVWFIATQPSANTQVYNCTSGSVNPINWYQIADKLKPPYSIKYPSTQLFRYPNLTGIESKFYYNFCLLYEHLIPAYLFDGMMYLSGGKTFMVKIYDKMHRALSLFDVFLKNDFHFKNSNVVRLSQNLKDNDKKLFQFDIKQLNWDAYWDNYWHGIRLYILKEDDNTLEEARNNLVNIYYRDKIIEIFFILLIVFLFYSTLFNRFINS